MKCLFLISFLFWPALSRAQLFITVSEPKVGGNKALVKLAFKNETTNTIQSARATVLILEKGTNVVGRESKWVIGNSKESQPLLPNATNSYNFVVTSQKPFAKSNVTAKIEFDRVVLGNNELADTKTMVKIQNGGD